MEGGKGGGVVETAFHESIPCDANERNGLATSRKAEKMLDAGFDGKERSCLDGYGS